MKLLIVRHAQSEGNATGNYSTAVSDSLSTEGHRQARCLADHLSHWKIDRVIASPRLRALQTIAPYLAAARRRAVIWPELAEACWHDERESAGTQWPSGPSRLPEPIADFFSFHNDEAIEPAHPETFAEGLFRVQTALCRLREMAPGSEGTILAVTHGHVIREFLNLLLNTRTITPFPHENCGTTLISFDVPPSVEFINRPAVGL